jgi:hypothetical protein
MQRVRDLCGNAVDAIVPSLPKEIQDLPGVLNGIEAQLKKTADEATALLNLLSDPNAHCAKLKERISGYALCRSSTSATRQPAIISTDPHTPACHAEGRGF